jgi:hypothetical protein
VASGPLRDADTPMVIGPGGMAGKPEAADEGDRDPLTARTAEQQIAAITARTPIRMIPHSFAPEVPGRDHVNKY